MDDFSKLSTEDQAKLALLEEEWERDGNAAIDRFFEKEPLTALRVMTILDPKAVSRALENVLIDKGLTNAEMRARCEKALRDRKH
jgi:hypothetical protein